MVKDFPPKMAGGKKKKTTTTTTKKEKKKTKKSSKTVRPERDGTFTSERFFYSLASLIVIFLRGGGILFLSLSKTMSAWLIMELNSLIFFFFFTSAFCLPSNRICSREKMMINSSPLPCGMSVESTPARVECAQCFITLI